MIGLIRSCSSALIKRSKKGASVKKPKGPKQKLKTLPEFQYPVSEASDRRLYVWGLAEHGALGLAISTKGKNNIAYTHNPRRLSFGERHKVVDLACGYGFTAFGVHSNDTNIVYGCGINTDSQLGYHVSDEKNKSGIIIDPRPVTLPLKESSTRVVGLAAGRAHLLILTDEGVFTLGNNGYGQCGRPIINNENYTKSKVVHHIPNIKGDRITAVSAGQDHSILLTEKGEVYAFGWGADGQTGLAHYRNEFKPSLVKGDLAGQNIIKVACVADCVLALSDKGKVFGWGNSEYGQLPVQGDTHQINIATEIHECQDLGHIVDIATGGSFCMILNNTGNVYVWGYGILGLGPQVQRVLKPTLIPSTLFGLNAYETNSQVSKIYCGISHLSAVTRTGDLYTWGNNKFGCLGLGHENNQFFPLKVAVGAQVQKVGCGVDHTIAICKPFV
ncbi:RCC1-like G exchanging factor-like protein [Cephus cinctus]|uniref:RCC1-like G exchanging factor-like protein n=1 Tax=Cephus cinctus TaxID=211228 RepID=A0AAJ7BJB0_CEPCN|nr:RCC1-like G exchanging factor-like protein [Cephus cinctus]